MLYRPAAAARRASSDAPRSLCRLCSLSLPGSQHLPRERGDEPNVRGHRLQRRGRVRAEPAHHLHGRVGAGRGEHDALRPARAVLAQSGA